MHPLLPGPVSVSMYDMMELYVFMIIVDVISIVEQSVCKFIVGIMSIMDPHMLMIIVYIMSIMEQSYDYGIVKSVPPRSTIDQCSPSSADRH